MTSRKYSSFDTLEEAQAENARLEGLLGIPNEDGTTGFDKGLVRRSLLHVEGEDEPTLDKYLVCVIEVGKYATIDLADPDTVVQLNSFETRVFKEEDN